MSKISTHVLDTSIGLPARAVAAKLEKRVDPDAWELIGAGVTDDDGRIALASDVRAADVGTYRLTFDTAPYFAKRGVEFFFPEIQITFVVSDAARDHHVPLLLNPFGYSTYRGS